MAEDLPLDSGSFRRVVGSYATGVVVVTTVLDGVDHAMTANSFTSVSLDPLLVLFCSDRESRFHEAVMVTKTWGVSVLRAEARDHARWFANRGRQLQGQFDGVPHHRGSNGTPLVDESLAWLECTTEEVSPAGDHDIVIGRVTQLRIAEPGAALIYWGGAFREQQ